MTRVEAAMPAYAVADLQDLRFGPDIATYLQAIDETLAPHGGRFLVHGSSVKTLEGPFAGDVVIIAFPNRVQAAHGTRRRPIRRSRPSAPATPVAGWC